MNANERTKRILALMREDCADAISFAEQVGSVDEFCANKLVRKAVVMSIINIGELAKKLPDEFKREHSEIPWRKIAGMRDLAAHGYHIMDYSIVWSVTRESVPELFSFILSMS